MVLEHCPFCSVGRLHAEARTYVHVYGGTLVHIPNVPARRCDVCGQIFFDEQVLRRSEILIGDSGPPPNQPPADAAPGEAAASAEDHSEPLRQRPE